MSLPQPPSPYPQPQPALPPHVACSMCRNTVATGTTYNLYNQWFICPACFPAYKAMYPQHFRGNVFREGTLLAVASGTELPALCVKCGQPGIRRFDKRLTYTPTWAFLGLFGGPVIFIVLLFIGQQSRQVLFHVCAQHVAERKRRFIAAWVLLALGTVCCFYGLSAMEPPENGTLASILIVLAGVMIVVALVQSMIAPPNLSAIKIVDRHVYIGGLHPALQDAATAQNECPVTTPSESA